MKINRVDEVGNLMIVKRFEWQCSERQSFVRANQKEQMRAL